MGGEKTVMNYLLLSRSLTYAQRSVKSLGRIGISAAVSRIPQSISVDGCGYCIKINEKNLTNSLVELKSLGLSSNRIFAAYDDGSYKEVEP